MKNGLKSEYLFSNRWLNRQGIVFALETFQDLIVIFLCLGLFFLMAMQLWSLFSTLELPLDFKYVTAKILFILILVELFELLVSYLQEHNVSVKLAVEITIVSLLREVIVHGALEISWLQVLSTCVLLSSLGAILVVCAKIPYRDYIKGTGKINLVMNGQQKSSSSKLNKPVES
jgi:uncharacterized membrane protein (DUF373 family)